MVNGRMQHCVHPCSLGENSLRSNVSQRVGKRHVVGSSSSVSVCAGTLEVHGSTVDERGVQRAIRNLKFEFWSVPTGLDIFTDSDWVWCTQSRRSTSRMFGRHGQHLLLHWCKLQATVALSSGEAELSKEIKKGAGVGLGMRTAGWSIGMEQSLRCHCASAVAPGDLNRVRSSRVGSRIWYERKKWSFYETDVRAIHVVC